MYHMIFTIADILTGITYTDIIVHLSPVSFSRTFSAFQTKTLYPLSSNSPSPPPLLFLFGRWGSLALKEVTSISQRHRTDVCP